MKQFAPTAAIVLLMLWTQHLVAQNSFNYHRDQFRRYLNEQPDSAKYHLIELGKMAQTRKEKIQFYQNSALSYLRIPHFDSADIYLDRAAAALASTDYVLQAQQYRSRSLLYYKQANFKRALDELFKAQPLLPKLDQDQCNELFLRMASTYLRVGQMDSSFFFARQVALTSSNELPTSALQKASAFSTLGQLYLYKSEFDSSFTYHYQALKIYEQQGNINGRSISLAEMAGIKLFQRKFDESLGYYNRAVADFKQLYKPCFSLYTNMGSVYKELNQSDSAKHYFTLAYEGAEKIGRIDIQGNAAGGLGSVLMEKEAYDSALFYFERSGEFFALLNHQQGLALCQMGIAKCYAEKGDFNRANAFMKTSFQLADSLQNTNLLKEYYQLEYEVLALENKHEEALKAYQQSISLRDSIFESDREKHIEELEVQYKVQLMDQENQLLKTKAKLRAENERNTRYIYGLITTALIGLLLLLFFINLSHRRKLQLRRIEVEQAKLQERLLLKRLLDAKNAIHTKNQLLTDLEKRLEADVDYTEISAKLLKKVNLTQEWAEFTLEFTALYHHFFDHLQELAIKPLTKNELRLSSLIKLNLSNKEIAELLFISVDAVKKGKNRLAKKIPLLNNETLTSKITRI